MSNELEFSGLFNSKHESKVPKGKAYDMSNASVARGILELAPRYELFGARTGVSSGDVGWGLGYGKFTGNEVQLLTMTASATSGNFTLKWRPTATGSFANTSSLPYNATATQMQDALEGLSYIRVGDVMCGGGPLPFNPITVEFRGQYASTNVEAIALNSSTLNGGASISVSEKVKGGSSEEFLAVIQHAGDALSKLYSINPNTRSFTVVATGLNSSDWYFAQYGQNIYAVNAVDGLNKKTLGGTWNGGAADSRPSAPQLKPSATFINTNPASAFFVRPGLTIGEFTGFTSTPTTGILGGNQVFVTNSAVQSGAVVSFTVTLTGATHNYQYRDYGYFTVTQNPPFNGAFNENSLRVTLINSDGTETEADYYQNIQDNYAVVGTRRFQLANKNRSSRTQVNKVRLSWYIHSAWGGMQYVCQLAVLDNWQNDTTAINVNNGPTRTTIDYAYSYLRTADLVESPLSPTLKSAVAPNNTNFGSYFKIDGRGSIALTSSDKVYFYRREKSTNKWRRLPNADGSYGITNSGSGGVVSFLDHLMEHEINDLPEYGEPDFPGPSRGAVPRVIGIWKQCLGIGGSKQLWLSWSGQPERFAPSPDIPDAPQPQEDDIARGVTEYVSDNRSEEVIGVHGQDSLYLVTPFSSYAKIGDLPSEATPPRRLPGSRGSVGERASCPLGGGVLVGTLDGLWYYSVSAGFNGQDNGSLIQREETKDVRHSYSSFITGGGSAMVVNEFNDEIWCFNGNKYLVNTRDREWISGTFTDRVKVALSVRPLGHFLLDSKGRMLRLYDANNPTTTLNTDAGSSVTWSYTTGLFDGDRMRIRGIEMRGSGKPSVTITVYDGLNNEVTKTYSKERSGQNWIIPVSQGPGYRFRMTFSGTKDDTIEYLSFQITESGPGKGS